MSFWLSNWTAADLATLFTLLTGVAIFGQWAAMLRTNKHFRVTERAYVRLSHVSEGRDGLHWLQGGRGEATLQISVKNCGRSPARISGVWLEGRLIPDGTEFPKKFLYKDERLKLENSFGHAFLMPEDEMFIPWVLEFGPEEYVAAESGEATLMIYGYIDYVDQFAEHHRGGYGRQYIPQTHGNNLGFPACLANLNYDEPRARGVGLDWEE